MSWGFLLSLYGVCLFLFKYTPQCYIITQMAEATTEGSRVHTAEDFQYLLVFFSFFVFTANSKI